MAERRIDGECRSCGTLVTLILNSEHPTCRTDGSRYIYTLLPDNGWCEFRCEGCGKVIDETFKSSEKVAPMNDDSISFRERTERNKRVQLRYDELMRKGKHGHYETMFQVVREEVERAHDTRTEICGR